VSRRTNLDTSSDSSFDNQPDSLSTPEGDNETLPGQPLVPGGPAPERPRGEGPHSEEPLYPMD